jgi:hypothetical protein
MLITHLSTPFLYVRFFLQFKNVETTKQKGKRRKIPHMPKPEEQEGMPQHQNCPHAKHREDKNPKYHEKQLKGNISRLT